MGMEPRKVNAGGASIAPAGTMECPDCGGSGFDPLDGGQCGRCDGTGEVVVEEW